MVGSSEVKNAESSVGRVIYLYSSYLMWRERLENKMRREMMISFDFICQALSLNAHEVANTIPALMGYEPRNFFEAMPGFTFAFDKRLKPL